LTRAIKKVLDWTPAERQRYTAANQEFVVQEFGIETWVEKVMGLYRKLL